MTTASPSLYSFPPALKFPSSSDPLLVCFRKDQRCSHSVVRTHKKTKAKQAEHVGTEPSSDPRRLHDGGFRLWEPLWALLSWSCGPFSPGLLNHRGSYNPSFLSSSGVPWAQSMLGYGSIHLFSSAVRGSLSEDDWARHWSMSMAEYHYESCYIYLLYNYITI